LPASIDEAVEFVLGKLDRPVGTRVRSTQAPGDFEVPRSVITEAIVNAVAHRDYRTPGFVQVIVYADRIEIWNPGELPHGLTPEKLRHPHAPMPRNPLLVEPLYRVKFVEKAGPGTTDMISECHAAGLPEPTFEQNGAHFVTTIWRDWLTDAVMDELGLNERQKKGVTLCKRTSRITNTEYQAVLDVSRATAGGNY
jgi:ATP-dependent DNA helicase RecG